jgi:hypothetical protein
MFFGEFGLHREDKVGEEAFFLLLDSQHSVLPLQQTLKGFKLLKKSMRQNFSKISDRAL